MTPPRNWASLPFDELFTDWTGGNRTVDQSDYLNSGALPVVDQGQGAIAGYVNDLSLTCRAPLPCLVFGDHTRIVKYVDYPFAIGAQGVKVLGPGPEIDPRFAFHALQRVPFPRDTGYTRHTRFLKRARIAFPPLAEQQKISAMLDKADEIRRKGQESLRLLDEFLRSVFVEMFGEPATNEKMWKVVSLEEVLTRPLRNGLSPAEGGAVIAQVLTLSAITGSRFVAAAVKTGHFAHRAAPDQVAHSEDFLICRGNGNLGLMGRAKFPSGLAAMTVFPDTMIAARIDRTRVEPRYLDAVWQTAVIRRSLERSARTTSGIHKINQSALLSARFPLPGLEEQRRYAKVADRIERLRVRRLAASAADLFASVAQRAFPRGPTSIRSTDEAG